MQIDFISDTVCPWCFIGKRRLARAIAMRPNIAFDVRFRPYRLDPTVPKGGMDRDAYMTAKFGKNGGVSEAQRVIAGEGVQDDVVERLFAAYFENGQDIGDIRVLADIADLSGMEGAQIADRLESDQDAALVEREDRLALEMGVTGVPAMIFANKVATSGAREPEVLAMVIDKALEMSAQQDAG